jgi:CRISPR-associated endonuclease Csn1
MRIFGIDSGIASIGWAVLEMAENDGCIVAAGTRMFDAPETDKERTPTNAVRRLHRGQRRVIRRRRQRMVALRSLFRDHGLALAAGRDALRIAGHDPWQLRATALERLLNGSELAVALGHIARHRGFRSNSKRDRAANAPDDTSKMLKAIAATQERLGQWRTVGQMFGRDPQYAERKRNRGQDYSRSVLRQDLEAEVRELFAAQRRMGSTLASEALQASFTRTAFFQRPLADSEHMVQRCPFEPAEMRTARRSYAFEMFRLLARLANLQLTARGDEWPLTQQQIALITTDFGRQKSITYRAVRKLLDLGPGTRFAGVAEKDEARDVVARAGGAAEGTAALRAIGGDAVWRTLMNAPAMRDRIAEVLTFREGPASIRNGLQEAGLQEPLLDAIMAGVADGKFAAFTHAGHISAKAARTLIPAMARGLRYDDACKEVGYDHAARPEVNLDDVRNPVVRKALSEILKQVRTLVHEFGLPDHMHIELARDIGKSAEERDKISNGIEDRNKQRDRLRTELAELLARAPVLEELVRYELWKEQNGRCLYTDEPINPDWIAASDNRVQVDHILPWSRFGDDSFMNKALCIAHANQAKRARTPFEWFSQDRTTKAWEEFSARVEGCKEMKGRKKGQFYLRRNAAEVEERFRNRNLGDTRYVARLALDLLARMYPRDGQRHVLARPGQLTAKLRRAWGVEDVKKDAQGKRRHDDRHHALDAIVLAATSEATLQRLTKAAQEAERQGAPRGFDFDYVPEPWRGFRQAALAAVDAVFVSRSERRRARGEAHAATIKQVRTIDGAPVVFERRPVEKLVLADIEKIPVPEPYGRVADPARLHAATVAELRRWIEAGKPKDQPPRSPRGDVIRKVRVASRDKPAVAIRGGTADRGDMVRVDVFTKPNRRGRTEYYLVPIYPHQVADRMDYPRPPNKAVVAYKPEADWACIDNTYRFRFSLHANSLIEATKPDGEVIMGYFKGLHRGTGALAISPHQSPRDTRGGIGGKTLLRLRKLSVDRLGRVHEVQRETRTWHGEACT